MQLHSCKKVYWNIWTQNLIFFIQSLLKILSKKESLYHFEINIKYKYLSINIKYKYLSMSIFCIFVTANLYTKTKKLH